VFVINLKAFLLDEKDFKVKRSLNAIKMAVANDEPKLDYVCDFEIVGNITCNNCLMFNLNKKSSPEIEYKMVYGFDVIYDNQSTLFNNVDYFVNDNPVTIPFTFNVSDTLKVIYNKTINKPVQIKLCGNKF
jgi:hypothetical protein